MIKKNRKRCSKKNNQQKNIDNKRKVKKAEEFILNTIKGEEKTK